MLFLADIYGQSWSTTYRVGVSADREFMRDAAKESGIGFTVRRRWKFGSWRITFSASGREYQVAKSLRVLYLPWYDMPSDEISHYPGMLWVDGHEVSFELGDYSLVYFLNLLGNVTEPTDISEYVDTRVKRSAQQWAWHAWRIRNVEDWMPIKRLALADLYQWGAWLLGYLSDSGWKELSQPVSDHDGRLALYYQSLRDRHIGRFNTSVDGELSGIYVQIADILRSIPGSRVPGWFRDGLYVKPEIYGKQIRRTPDGYEVRIIAGGFGMTVADQLGSPVTFVDRSCAIQYASYAKRLLEGYTQAQLHEALAGEDESLLAHITDDLQIT